MLAASNMFCQIFTFLQMILIGHLMEMDSSSLFWVLLITSALNLAVYIFRTNCIEEEGEEEEAFKETEAIDN